MPSNFRSLRRKRLEANPGRLAVEVIGEVEQVGFQERVVGVLVEGRSAAQVDRTGVDGAVGPHVPAGVHAVRRVAHGVGHLDVGRREPEQPPPHVTHDDRSPCLVETPQQPRRHVHLSAGERPANGCGADGLVDPVGSVDQGDGLDLEVELLPELAQECDVAFTVTPEVEVLADHHRPRGQGVHEHLLDEVAGGLHRPRLVEAEHDGRVEPGLGQELQLRRRVGQQPGRRLRPHDAGRMAVEGHEHAAGAKGSRQPPHLGDDGRVAQVDAVERANGDHGALPRPRDAAEVADDLHGWARYPYG